MISQESSKALTDEQIIERLATEVMGWETGNRCANCGLPIRQTKEQIDPMTTDGEWVCGKECAWQLWDNGCPHDKTGTWRWWNWWNPLTDWNHWRQVEEKVMEMGRFALLVEYATPVGNDPTVPWSYCGSDLPTRCRALLSALDSLKQS